MIFTRSTGEHVDATMKGPSEKGDLFAVLEYMKGGQVVTHPCAPLSKIEFFIRSPSPSLEWSRRCTHTMHSLTCMSVVVCVVRKPRPCNSYSRRRDRINSVLWRSYYKGGGGYVVQLVQAPHCFFQS